MAQKSLLSFKLIFRLSALGLILLAITWLLPQYTLGPLGSFLVVDQEPIPADAIVVLLGSSHPDRILKAYELFQDNVAPKIAYVSGFIDRELQKTLPANLFWLRNSELYTRGLISLSVPESSIEVIAGDDVFDTASELRIVADYAARLNWQTVILVSTASHTRRINMIWKRLGRGINYRVVAVPLLSGVLVV